jgi:phage-related protein
MADMRSQVQSVLEGFQSSVTEASEQVAELEGLMDTMDQAFEDFFNEMQQETQQRIRDLNKLQAQCHKVETDVGRLVAETNSALGGAESEVGSDIDKLEEGTTKMIADNDGLQGHIEDSDNTVQNLIDQIAEGAENVGSKAKSAIEHVISVGERTADTFGNTLVDGLKSVNSTVEEAFNGFQQDANNLVNEVQDNVQNLAQSVTDAAQSFAEEVQNQGKSAESGLMDAVGNLENSFLGNLGELGDNVQSFVDNFTQLSEMFTNVTESAVTTVGEIGDAMDSVNIGLKGVVGTIQNVKDILDEISL